MASSVVGYKFEVLPSVNTIVLSGLSLIIFIIVRSLTSSRDKARSTQLRSPPVVPGLPLIGNLLQLKEKKPHKTFTKLAETFGPIYSIKLGSIPVLVLNSTDVAKEAMVTRFPSISTRKLSSALQILTANKCMVATSDYNDFHKTLKRHILTNVLGATAQKQHRHTRDEMMENLSNQFNAVVKRYPLRAVNFREIFESELFGLSMKQAVGKDVESIYVEELGGNITREQINKVLVQDLMEGALEVDWRDFFPYLNWVPNKAMEKIQKIHTSRMAVMKALVAQQRKRIEAGEAINCFLDYMISEAKELTEDQLLLSIWEPIIEAADTTLVTSEWAIYHLANNRDHQEHLYQEIQSICGSRKIEEENLSQLPFLNAVFHETLRKQVPVPVIPLRYVHEDTELGGYKIPAGTEIAVNIYGCNMDKKQWEDPEEWKPERFLDSKYDPVDLFKTMSFGAGKRVCAGSLQAMLITCTAVGRLVQEFEWKLKEGEKDEVSTLGLTGRKLHPLQVIPKARPAK